MTDDGEAEVELEEAKRRADATIADPAKHSKPELEPREDALDDPRFLEE